MNKAFVEEGESDDDELAAEQQVPSGVKNYITQDGYKKLKDELLQLIDAERPGNSPVLGRTSSRSWQIKKSLPG